MTISKTKKKVLLVTILSMVLSLSLSFYDSVSAISSYGSLDPNRFTPNQYSNITWTDPGKWTTIDVTSKGLSANNPLIDASQKVKDIINSTSGNRILYFPTGIYYFKTDLHITKGNIRLKGSGTSTIFNINATSTTNAEICFVGGGVGSVIDVTSTPARGDQTVKVASTKGLAVGDDVFIYDKDSSTYLDGIYGESQICRIKAINGTTITFDRELGIPMTKNAKLKKINVIKNVGLENFKVTRSVAANEAWTSNLGFDYVDNGYVKDVESAYSERAHIDVYYSTTIAIDRLYAHHSFDYGGGGQSYGVMASASTLVRATDCKFNNLRHSAVLQNGANHCVISYNTTTNKVDEYHGASENDYVCHGSFAHNNLIEGNLTESKIAVDNVHGANGPYNTLFRNSCTRVGSMSGSGNDYTNVIGNLCTDSSLFDDESHGYVGANQVNGAMNWGRLSSSSTIPASLYLTAKPSFLTSWPRFSFAAKSWEFTSSVDGWTATGGLNSFVRETPNVPGGFIKGTLSSNDSQIKSSDNLGVAISNTNNKYIRVHMKNNTAAVKGKIYFTTNASASWNESKSKTFDLTSKDTGFREYIIDMSTVPTWTGTLKQIRIDPIDDKSTSSGTFELNYFRIQS